MAKRSCVLIKGIAVRSCSPAQSIEMILRWCHKRFIEKRKAVLKDEFHFVSPTQTALKDIGKISSRIPRILILVKKVMRSDVELSGIVFIDNKERFVK